MVGKVSFETEALVENCIALVDILQKVKPASVKGAYLMGMGISSTMGPGIKVDLTGIIKK
jgi:large subunit ribosomal protein L1